MSDVPLGFFLSGGIDSSSILAAAKSLDKNLKLNAFTIGFNEKTFDETMWAKIIAKHFDVNHTIEYLNYSDFKDNAKKILSLNDIPIADPSIIPTNLLCRLTKKKVTVEIENMIQLNNVLGLKFDRILFDNVSLAQLKKYLKICKGKYETEYSGNANKDTLMDHQANHSPKLFFEYT